MKVSKSVKELLGECRIEGQVLYLPNRQLPRNEYQAVHRVLKFLGGVWDRKAQGHVFKKENLEEMLNTLLQAGEITDKKKQNQFFSDSYGSRYIPMRFGRTGFYYICH